MRIETLKLRSFRSYESLNLEPPEGITVLVGENGAGKTNVLEAVHLCCLGRSHRTSNDREMVREGAEQAFVQMRVIRGTGKEEIALGIDAAAGRRKTVMINGKTAGRIGELFGHAAAVIFSPEDLTMVRGVPQERRRFMDMLLTQRRSAYFFALQRYTAALRHRNALLKGEDLRQLPVWDEEMARYAEEVVRQRRNLAEELNRIGAERYAYISGKDRERFSAAYQSRLDPEGDVTAQMLRGLEASRAEDIRRQTTSFGPHHDDLILRLSGQEMRAFASQGQVRTAALSLKLSAFDILTQTLGEAPLLLLDDVLSELDPERRRRLMKGVSGVQTFLTCTDLSDLTGAEPACVLRVTPGKAEAALSAP